MTRRSLRRGWLVDRVRAFFSHARKDPVDVLLDVEKPDWEAEDHLESPAVDAPVVDPWEADAALGIEAAESKGSSYQRGNRKYSTSGCGGGLVDEHSPRSGGAILESISPASSEDELPLSAPALEMQGACPSSAEREPPEQRVCNRSTEKRAERTLNADGHDPGLGRTGTEPDMMGSAEEQVKSDGSAHDGISDDLGNEEFEILEAIDVELQDHETLLDADITDEYFDYDADAHQLPWSQRDPGDTLYGDVVRRAREKAASIASIVEVTSRRELEELLHWLTELFLQLEHPATFRAIKRIAAGGITADLLRAVFALRDCWMERREWWVGRYGPSREVRLRRRGSRGLSWAIAERVCRSRADYAPEDMIDEDWFREWLSLAPGMPGYLLFAEYVNAKVTDPDLELLNDGLMRVEQADGREDLGEDRGWWRTLPRYDEDIRFGFSVLTPFRDGFGPPGYPENQEPFRGAQSDA